MGKISNRFFVNAVVDGDTIHGSLRSDKSLVQMWTGAAAVPDWTVAANQPTITLTILRGSTYTVPVTGSVHWYLNGTEITNGSSYEIGTKTVTYGGQSISGVPYCKIKRNLASSSNVDMDIITCTGKIEVSGAAIDFSAEVEVKITNSAGKGYIGVISFPNGSDIDRAGQEITLVPSLYNETNNITNFTVKWYFNGTEVTATSGTGNRISGKNLIVTEASVTDYAVVNCEFYVNGEVVATEFVGVDDTQDAEFMYIQYNGSDGKIASLHSGQTVTFDIWVGSSTDPQDTNIRPRYTTYKLTVLKSDGTVLSGYNQKNITANDGSYKKGTETFTYQQVYAAGGNITGIVTAE